MILLKRSKPSGTALFCLLCDDGIEREYLDTRFFLKMRWREQVINKLLT
jgi:hypothetical protein